MMMMKRKRGEKVRGRKEEQIFEEEEKEFIGKYRKGRVIC